MRDDPTIRQQNPIRIAVAMPFTEELGPRDHSRLDEIEHEVERRATGSAILVGVITNPTMREFVLHTDRADWLPSFHEQLRSAFAPLEVQMMAETDPDWSLYRTFLAE